MVSDTNPHGYFGKRYNHEQSMFQFSLTDYVKQDRPGSVLGNVTLYKYPDKKLCVYETLQAYLQETRLCRSLQRLLISYIKPFKAVTSATIGRWIKTVLTQAGIDTNVFTAHSTRSASTSKAAAAAVPVNVILATAGMVNRKYIS